LAGWVLLAVIIHPRALSADDLPEIRARGVLRVAISPNANPDDVSFQSGTASGFEGEAVQGFASLLHVKLEIVKISASERRFSALQAGRADLLVSTTPTEALRKLASFTTEIFPGGVVLVTRRPHPAITSLDQLRGKRVGVRKGGSPAEVAPAALPPDVKLDFLPSNEALDLALRTGQIDAMASILAGSFMSKRGDPDLEVGLVLAPSPGPAWAVGKEAPQLLAAAGEYLLNLRKTATWDRLVVKYYGEYALEVLRKSRVIH
jgi:polar amino acid transport system substrate-binding protein